MSVTYFLNTKVPISKKLILWSLYGANFIILGAAFFVNNNGVFITSFACFVAGTILIIIWHTAVLIFEREPKFERAVNYRKSTFENQGKSIQNEINRSVVSLVNSGKSIYAADEKILKKSRPDPVQIIIACGIFAILFSVILIMFSLFSLIAVSCACLLVFYQLISKPKNPESEYKYRKRRLPIYAISLVVLPFIIASAIAYDGYDIWKSIPITIFVWALTLSFWYTLLFVPLAIYNSYKSSTISEPNSYPKISIIIPAYNEEKVIALTIDGIINADYPNKEIIVVDDGSTDKTLELAQKYKPQVKVLHKENGGKASALNFGLALANGEIIVIVDADTIIGRNALRVLAKEFLKKEIAAVAGNIRIRNTVNLLTWCQALEYLTGIQIMRRGLGYFGAIPVVPGALGAFRRDALKDVGDYHKETLVEDFDATLKVLKSGYVVQGTEDAIGYTQAPQTLDDLYKQRKRWNRGNLQVIRRHHDIMTNTRFGFLHKLTFPILILNQMFIPFTGLAVWVFAAISVIQGEWKLPLLFGTIFIVLQYLLSSLAVRINKDDKKIIAYSFFMVLGYKQINDFFCLKAVFDEILKRKSKWTSAERVRS